jgi:hypothetical protein
MLPPVNRERILMPRTTSPSTVLTGASIWLMPSAADGAFLATIVDDLARRFGSPLFEPHLTLAGDLPDRPETYVAILEKLAGLVRRFAQPVDDIVLTDAYFRSFYAKFKRTAELDILRQYCVDRLGGDLSSFMPHVSLLYGPVSEPGKSEAAAELRRSVTGRVVTFDRVVVTNSSDTTPVSEWCVHAERSLRHD